MNKKQLVVLWLGGLISTLFFVRMALDRHLDPDEFLGGLCGVMAVAIIVFLFFYTLRDKGEMKPIEKKLPAIVMAFLMSALIFGLGFRVISETAGDCSKALSACKDASGECEDTQGICAQLRRW